jgi:phenylglyoxylate dehydrogenase epsilon subunit
VAVGVVPNTEFLAGTDVAIDRGIVVDAHMRSTVDNIWAAGDVAQGPNFYDGTSTLNGIVPDAVDQGRTAGMAMAGDPAVAPYRGAVPLNTYTFFGQQALAVGVHESVAGGAEAVRNVDAEHHRYLKVVLDDNRLVGIFGINTGFDPGIMWELILRRTDLASVRERLLREPREAARALMSQAWR